MGLETGILASRLGFEGGTEKKKKKKEEEEKIPHMCESIDHRPLRGRCPKGEIVRMLETIGHWPKKSHVRLLKTSIQPCFKEA